MRASIWTIGHSTHTTEAFVAMLRAHEVTCVVDVRRYPGSRRYPHFGGGPLAAALAAADIGYRHLPALGGRREPRPDSPNGAWRNAQFRGYADHVASDEFRLALSQLEALAAARPTALMCAEAVPWRCHRNLLADALVARGWDVCHILSHESGRAHQLHAAAVVGRDGGVHYPAAEPQQAGLFDSAEPAAERPRATRRRAAG